MTAKPADNCLAEIMAVGDEIVTGYRLDTNTQWISQRLGELGISVCFFSAVGDQLPQHTELIKTATRRVDLVVMTGGLGPTADDLTRQAVAQAAGVELEFCPDELVRIERFFERSGRTMPTNNRSQAYFPRGSKLIPNPEGTAAGIDLIIQQASHNGGQPREVRIIALPGVPAEMKQMWTATVEPRLKAWTQSNSIYHHHTLHCFGAGESTIEEMLPNLIERGRDPSVGITASQAVISLRVATRAATLEDCQKKMEPTIRLIKDRLGDLVFGEHGQTLAYVVARQLQALNAKLAMVDFGLGGQVQRVLTQEWPESCLTLQHRLGQLVPDQFEGALSAAEFVRHQASAGQSDSVIGVAIGQIDRDEQTVTDGRSEFELGIASVKSSAAYKLRFWGHSAWREERAIKQVLNQLRLHLKPQ